MNNRRSNGVLQSITNFFFTRKRKRPEPLEKDEPTQKLTRKSMKEISVPAPIPPPDFLALLPREMLWRLFEKLDLKSIMKVYSTSKRLKFEVKAFLTSDQHIPYIANNFSALSYHEQRCFVSFLVELLFDHFERRRENKAAQWMEKAYEFRHKLVLPIFIEQTLLHFPMSQFETLFDLLYNKWFAQDVIAYIEARVSGLPAKKMEKSLMERFVRTFYDRRQGRVERASIVSLFLRQEEDSRKHFVMAQLLFGPHANRQADSVIDFDGLEDGDGDHLTAANDLDGFPELFNMLNELRIHTSRARLRWSRAQMFLVLEDITTQPLWSMSNFARLLLVCPFLAVATTIIRCKNQLYEDAAFVLYHLMLLCEGHASSLDLLVKIMKELDKPNAEELRRRVVEYATSATRTGSERKNKVISEVVQEAFDRTFKAKPKKTL